MLSYQHAYHAGNFADVLKHIVLCHVIDYMTQKDKPFYFHDTHAGRGMYPLALGEMQKLREHENGIAKIWPLLLDDKRLLEKNLAGLLPYAKALKRYNQGKTLTHYPGSGLFAQALMRNDDQLVLTELHPGEFASLHSNTLSLPNVHIQHVDAWQALFAALPPRQKRGVILIDPSYELKNEYQQVIDGVKECLRRFEHGVYLVWYPLVSGDNVNSKLLRGISKLEPPSLLQIEFSAAGQGSKSGLTGSGMLVINPPWQLDSSMNALLPHLLPLLASGSANYSVKWLLKKP